jgi:hypothetical protein
VNASSEPKQEEIAAKSVSSEWVDDEIRLLVKAAKIIPVGTRERLKIKLLGH